MKAITISLAAHLALVTALTLASILAPGLLPNPRSVILAFHDNARMVRLEDIELKTEGTKRTGSRNTSSAPTVSRVPDTVPLAAPTGIGPDPGLDPKGGSEFRGPGPIETDTRTAVAGIGHVEPPPPPPVPKLPVRLHAGIDAPRKTVDAMPGYPPIARASRVSGVVILEATIDEHGDVTATRILRSIPLLDQAATDAVRSWKFTPARLNGQPVAVLMTVTVNFALQ